jgi:hypothetical protein
VDDFLNCTDVNGTASNSGFNEYLKLAPTVTDATDPEQCGKLRGFFGFSALFVNDEQICEDIEQIGSSAGSLFNGFSFGNSGGSKGDAVTLDKPESRKYTLNRHALLEHLFWERLSKQYALLHRTTQPRLQLRAQRRCGEAYMS